MPSVWPRLDYDVLGTSLCFRSNLGTRRWFAFHIFISIVGVWSPKHWIGTKDWFFLFKHLAFELRTRTLSWPFYRRKLLKLRKWCVPLEGTTSNVCSPKFVKTKFVIDKWQFSNHIWSNKLGWKQVITSQKAEDCPRLSRKWANTGGIWANLTVYGQK